MEEKKFRGKMNAFSLAFQEPIPKVREIPGKELISWGRDNKYPYFLIELAHSSSLHGAICKAMIRQVAGKGLRIKNSIEDVRLQQYMNICNSDGESLYEVIQKFITDYIIFGGFTSQEVWNRGQTSFDLYHTDISTVRSTKKEKDSGRISKYLISDYWEEQYNADKNLEIVPAFDPSFREGRQLKMHMGYFPGSCYYPISHYSSGILAACMDYKVIEFHNSNLDSGMVPSIIANFTSGIPTEEEAQELYNDMQMQFGGSKKTGKILMNFNESPETKTEFTVLNPSSADKQYSDMMNVVLTEILSAHGVVSSELVGISQPGKLGTSEFIQSWELYHSTVIHPKQLFIEDQINRLLSYLGFVNQVEIEKLEPVAFSLPAEILIKIKTINEMRNSIGMKDLEGGDIIVEPSKITEIGKGDAPIEIESPTATPETPAQMRNVK